MIYFIVQLLLYISQLFESKYLYLTFVRSQTLYPLELASANRASRVTRRASSFSVLLFCRLSHSDWNNLFKYTCPNGNCGRTRRNVYYYMPRFRKGISIVYIGIRWKTYNCTPLCMSRKNLLMPATHACMSYLPCIYLYNPQYL